MLTRYNNTFQKLQYSFKYFSNFKDLVTHFTFLASTNVMCEGCVAIQCFSWFVHAFYDLFIKNVYYGLSVPAFQILLTLNIILFPLNLHLSDQPYFRTNFFSSLLSFIYSFPTYPNVTSFSCSVAVITANIVITCKNQLQPQVFKTAQTWHAWSTIEACLVTCFGFSWFRFRFIFWLTLSGARGYVIFFNMWDQCH